MRIIKNGHRILSMDPPPPDDPQQNCPQCGARFEAGKVTRGSYVMCGHLTCFNCVTKEGCQCGRTNDSTPPPVTNGVTISHAPSVPSGGPCSSSSLQTPPPRSRRPSIEVMAELPSPYKLAKRKIIDRIARWNISYEAQLCLKLIQQNGGVPTATETCTVRPSTGVIRVIEIDIRFCNVSSTLECSKCQFIARVSSDSDLCIGHRKIIHHVLAQHTTSFTCPVCGVKEETSGNYVNHWRNHHGQQPTGRNWNGVNGESSPPNQLGNLTSPPPVLMSPPPLKSSPPTANAPCSSRSADKTDDKQKEESTTRKSVKFEIPSPPPLIKGAGLFRCVYCDARFTERNHLGGHYSSDHKTERPFQCDKCEWSFTTKKNLKIHLDTHNTSHFDRHQCTICRSSFSLQSTLISHLKIHGVNVQKETPTFEQKIILKKEVIPPPPLSAQPDMFPIPIIMLGDGSSASYEEEPQLQQEPEVEKPVDKKDPSISKLPLLPWKKFPCQHCDKVFSMEINLLMHYRLMHSSLRPNICKQCGWSFPSSIQLISHRATHSQRRSYKCVKCSATFSQKYRLELHSKSEHSPASSKKQSRGVGRMPGSKRSGKTPVCVYCNKSFDQPHLLAAHLTKSHSDKRPYPCDLCSWPFETKAILKNHKATHLGKKEFKCDLCGSQFLRKVSKEGHMLRRHQVRLRLTKKDKLGGDKILNCAECQSPFDEGEVGEHRKVALSHCGHISCMACVIRDSKLGCGQCKTVTAPKSKPPAAPRLSRKRRRGRPRKGRGQPPVKKIKLEVNSEIGGVAAKKRKSPVARRTRKKWVSPRRREGPVTRERTSPLRKLRPLMRRSSSSSKENKVVASPKVSSPKAPPGKLKVTKEVVKKEAVKKEVAKKEVPKKEVVKQEVGIRRGRGRPRKSFLPKYPCQHCDLAFEEKKDLGSHMLEKHLDIRPFPCEECQWPFLQQLHLDQHLGRMHRNSKSFKCRTCGKWFSTEEQLLKHNSFKHLGKRSRS